MNNKRILYLSAGTLTLLFLGLIYAWSIFRNPLTLIYKDWTATQISMTFTVSIVFFCLGGFTAGKLAAKLKHRIVLLISAAFIFTGFMMIALLLDASAPTRSLWVLYIFYGMFGGGGVGLAYNTLIGVITRWFPGRTGMASGVLLLGFGIGGIALGSLVNVFIKHISIGTIFAILGILIAIVLFIASFIIKAPVAASIPPGARSNNDTNVSPVARSDNDTGVPPGAHGDAAAEAADTANVAHGKTAVEAAKPAIRNFRLGEATAKPPFWMLFLWNVFMCVGGLLVINSAAPIASRYGIAAALGLIVSLFNGVGRPLLGTLFDIIGRRNAMTLNTLIMLLGGIVLLTGAMTESAVLIFIGLPLIGTSYGGTTSLLSAVINKFYGPQNFQVILATATFGFAVAGVTGPLLSSRLQEAAGGEYFTSFVMVIVTSLIAFILNLLMTVFSRRAGLED
ncbi:MAG: MFS transporter [Clostridiales Family XIII bacterium]|nr:MFS transporter [Clostridiales Family XIII bacterium]